jgi:hypothetical protein
VILPVIVPPVSGRNPLPELAITKAVVANCVVLVPGAAVGATGTPVRFALLIVAAVPTVRLGTVNVSVDGLYVTLRPLSMKILALPFVAFALVNNMLKLLFVAVAVTAVCVPGVYFTTVPALLRPSAHDKLTNVDVLGNGSKVHPSPLMIRLRSVIRFAKCQMPDNSGLAFS